MKSISLALFLALSSYYAQADFVVEKSVKKATFMEGEFEVFYNELPSPIPGAPLLVSGGKATNTCSVFMASALVSAGIDAKSSLNHGGGDYLCEMLFIGSKQAIDDYLAKIKSADESILGSLIRGSNAVVNVALIVAGVGQPNPLTPAVSSNAVSGLMSAPSAGPRETSARLTIEAIAAQQVKIGDDDTVFLARLCTKANECSFLTGILYGKKDSAVTPEMKKAIPAFLGEGLAKMIGITH